MGGIERVVGGRWDRDGREGMGEGEDGCWTCGVDGWDWGFIPYLILFVRSWVGSYGMARDWLID